jgi:hypothetical protein
MLPVVQSSHFTMLAIPHRRQVVFGEQAHTYELKSTIHLGERCASG